MTKQTAKKWIQAFKKAKFKCIVPHQVMEALGMLYGSYENKTKK